MSAKMQVLFVKQTGHVLAAFTRTSDPEGKPKVNDLVGSGLLVRNPKILATTGTTGGEEITVDPDSLDVSVIDFNPDVFRSPSGFAVSGGTAELLGPVTPEVPVLAEDKLTVSLGPASAPVNAPDDLKVWAMIEKILTPTDTEPLRRIMEGKIKKTETHTDLSPTIKPGGAGATIPLTSKYYALTLVEGRQPVFAVLPP
ncbi:MAG TPA: hypothetical protein VK582_00760 [Pyrinomonadaceae bacterium]|nr:hypothetical protein [Pyrinomonadaceae bacterium]